MGFLTGIDITAIADAAAMCRALRCVVIDLFDPQYTQIHADDDENVDRQFTARDASFIIDDQTGDGWRVTITDSVGPAPVQLGEKKRRVFELADKVGADRAIAALEATAEEGTGPAGASSSADEGEDCYDLNAIIDDLVDFCGRTLAISYLCSGIECGLGDDDFNVGDERCAELRPVADELHDWAHRRWLTAKSGPEEADKHCRPDAGRGVAWARERAALIAKS